MKNLLFTVLFAFIIISFFSLQSCDKKVETKGIIYVKLLSDSTIVVPNAYVRLEKYDIKVEGMTDDEGVFSHFFNNEAIIDVVAVVDSTVSPTGSNLSGKTIIKLIQGKTVGKTVFVN